MGYRSKLMVCTTMAASVISGTAYAQQTAAPSGTVLEEITVTARKTSESIMDVPLAVTAISAEQMEERHIMDVNDIAAFTPGYTNQNQAVARNDRYYRQAIIRGIIPGNALATRQAASIFVDGALVFGGSIDNLTDIERVEVVKGPQSAYFGRGTFSGAINVVTRPPRLDRWSGKATVDVSSFKTTNINGTVEGPVIEDKLAVRVGVFKYYTAGQYSNVGFPGYTLGQRSTRAATGNFLFKPLEGFTIRGFANYTVDNDGLPANAEYTQSYYNCNGGAAPAGTFNYLCGKLPKVPTATRFWNASLDANAFNRIFLGSPTIPNSVSYHGPGFPDHMGLTRRMFNARISADYELPAGYMLSTNGAWDRDKKGFLQAGQFIDTRGIPNPFFATTPNVLPYNYGLVSGQAQDDDENAEARVTSPQTDRLHWMAGFNYFHDRSQSMTPSYGNAGFTLGNGRSIFVNHTYGAFASATFDIWNGISIIGEGRRQWETIWQTTLAGANPQFEDTSTSFTPRVILQYKSDDDTTTYLSYAEGTRPIEFNTNFFTLTTAQQNQILAQASVGGLVPADRIRMGEVGVKGLFLDGSLRLLAAVYKGRWTARHIPNTVTYTLANGLQGALQTTSAGGIVDLSGIEIEGAYRMTSEITIDGSFGIAHTDIRRTNSADALTLTGRSNVVGTSLPFYPVMQGNLAVTYARQLTETFSGYMRLDYFYRGKMYDSEANLAWAPPSNKFNMALGVETDAYKLELYGRNVTDNRAPTSIARNGIGVFNAAGTQTSTASGIAVSLPDRNSFGVRATAKF
ncbi:MAG: hypothetical protein EXQ84_06075 [Rhodospirillaceae bacterium]|nr:hypothetical protein [Rhodospirillaceae bacterium]